MSWHVRRFFAVGAALALLATFAACNHTSSRGIDGELLGLEGCAPVTECHDGAKVCTHPTVHALACDLDHLERHIDCYGSVVAKVPDVWGQARLTQYREEFEKEMAKDLPGFQDTMNGSLSRSDQAFFAQAVTIAAAAQPKPPVIGRVTSVKSTEPPILVAGSRDTVVKETNTIKVDDKTSNQTEKTTTTKEAPAPEPAAPKPPEKVAIPDVPKTVDLITDKDVIARNPAKVTTLEFAKTGAGGISLEPTIHLAQKARYLDYLNQLRRTNEGDDKADAPGYSLNLMRIPVSVLPGKKTDEGYGAEITFTIDPVLGDDLLPMTFRNLVINDVVQQLGLPMTKFLNEERLRSGKEKFLTEAVRELLLDAQKTGHDIDGWQAYIAPPPIVRANPPAQVIVPAATQPEVLPPLPMQSPPARQEKRPSRHNLPHDVRTLPDDPARELYVRKVIESHLSVPAIPFSNGFAGRRAVPTSQLLHVYGLKHSFEIAIGAQQATIRDTRLRGYIHLPDIQAFLREEAEAAYRFLAANPTLLTAYCDRSLVTAIRSQEWLVVADRRKGFRELFEQLVLTAPPVVKPTGPIILPTGITTPDTTERERRLIRVAVTSALAWGIVVDSALLNDRLVSDVCEAATSKGAASSLVPDAWPQFFLPNPPPDARCAFRDYVKLRWPVYVFALDPVTQDQNIADSLSTRREMQLALAVAFTNGFIGANTLTKYTRRLEAEYQTIALNRTQVGFAHGENVFGWRFYPRFQTPDTRGNLETFVRDQLIGGPNRNQLLRERRLEPGARECVALVVMPSFVPYVTVDAESNWFALANPKQKVLDHTQAARLSKTVRTLQKCEGGIIDADCYREGELRRLQSRVEQLANRLPSQTLVTPVPILNTLGGFEMFSNGTTDLAPELYGWYGAPGVDRDTETTLFLVGDHFSPLHTRVIVGNKEIDAEKNQKMLSRQVMQVKVPAGAITVKDPSDGTLYAQAHVATPYGVTRELLIPIVSKDKPAEKPAEGYALKPNELTATYGMTPSPKFPGAHQYGQIVKVSPAKIAVDWDDASGSVPRTITVRFVFEWNGKEVPVPACTALKVAETDNEFTIPKGDLEKVAEALIRAIQTDNLRAGANPFDAPFVTKRVEVTPTEEKDKKVHALKGKTTSNQLKVTFVGQYLDAPCPPADKSEKK